MIQVEVANIRPVRYWQVRYQFDATVCINSEGLDVLADGCEQTQPDFLEENIQNTFVCASLK